MCQIVLFTNIHCKCQWGEITLPCRPGMGFSTCGQLSSGIAQREPTTYKSGYKLCPEHGWQGMYDRNMVRMVVEVKTGRKWGKGPSLQDAGCDIKCVVM
jgi:hypothetical protein